MRSTQRLGWWSSSYGLTLATKLDGAQGKAGQVRGIANSKDSELMQWLIHGRRSVRGHPKVRSELSAMEHQNFLFNIKGYIHRQLKCTLLDPEGCSGDCIGEGPQSSKYICGGRTSCSARRSSPKGMVVSETSSGKNVKRKVAPIGQISRRDKS
ncbi:hypothetical protein BHM03_00047849 [Ensete ventricosum]|nr:hypothetical protein BHM03_00047849 [Ensete ventricosum]